MPRNPGPETTPTRVKANKKLPAGVPRGPLGNADPSDASDLIVGASGSGGFGDIHIRTFRDGRSEDAVVTVETAMEMDRHDVDCSIDLIQKLHVIQRSDGSTREHLGLIRGIGAKHFAYLIKLMWYAPLVLSPPEWDSKVPEIEGLYCRETVAPTIMHLRQRVFDERNSTSFLVTGSPLSYGWNRGRSYRLILTEEYWEFLHGHAELPRGMSAS